MDSNLSVYHHSKIKRCMDICLSVSALLFVGILFIVLWVVYKVTVRESVFYLSERVGLSGTVFKIYKFRTMSSLRNNEREINKDDWFIYRVLRVSHLDEIPQVINVLFNDMSIVGPRPYVPAECEQLDGILNNFHLRHLIKPGITGLSQTNYQHDNSRKVGLTKLQDDLRYIENASFMMDLQIIVDTAFHVIRLRGV